MKFETNNETISKILGSRSQFTYHHDWQRSNELQGCSRGEVGQILKRKFTNEGEYLEQVRFGTLKYLFDNHSKEILDDVMNGNMSIQECQELWREANKVIILTREDKEKYLREEEIK